jgi:glycosyltransferase involved in cell wall biosynthesis
MSVSTTSGATHEGQRNWVRDPYSISAVLPAYNEEAVIEQTVRRVASVLASLGRDFEVVVTNDGSQDRTGAILARLHATEASLHLRVITHQTNRGYGAALASGFDAACGRLILMLDSDGQFDVSEVVRLLTAMNERVDMVIGYVEVPVTHLPRTAGSPTGAHPRVIARAFIELFKLRVHLNRDLAAAPAGAMRSRRTPVRAA